VGVEEKGAEDDIWDYGGKSGKKNPGDFNFSPSIIWVIKRSRSRWAGHEARIMVSRGGCRVLVGKSKLKRQLGRPRLRWEDIKM
jgi:hypothetical protein